MPMSTQSGYIRITANIDVLIGLEKLAGVAKNDSRERRVISSPSGTGRILRQGYAMTACGGHR